MTYIIEKSNSILENRKLLCDEYKDALSPSVTFLSFYHCINIKTLEHYVYEDKHVAEINVFNVDIFRIMHDITDILCDLKNTHVEKSIFLTA